ncbi:MAG: hypothetical protein ACKOF3_01460 [Spartobacteria bacterium]
MFTRPDRIIVLLASWAPAGDTSGQPERVQLRLPRKDLPFVPEISRARTVALADSTSVAGQWRRDLAKEENLKPEFANPEVPPASLSQMAKDPLAARRMVLTRRNRIRNRPATKSHPPGITRRRSRHPKPLGRSLRRT